MLSSVLKLYKNTEEAPTCTSMPISRQAGGPELRPLCCGIMGTHTVVLLPPTEIPFLMYRRCNRIRLWMNTEMENGEG